MNIQDVQTGKYFGGLGNFDAGEPTGIIRTNVFLMIKPTLAHEDRRVQGDVEYSLVEHIGGEIVRMQIPHDTEVKPMKPAGRTSAGDEVFLYKENCDE